MKLKGKLDVPNLNHSIDDLPTPRRAALKLQFYGGGKIRLSRGAQLLFQGSREGFKAWLVQLRERNGIE